LTAAASQRSYYVHVAERDLTCDGGNSAGTTTHKLTSFSDEWSDKA